MMRYRTLLLLPLLLLGALSSRAQSTQKALAIHNENGGHGNTIGLDRALSQIEQAFDVTFMYESSTVQDKFAVRKKALSDNLNDELQRVLTPYDLQYAKVGKHSYVIMTEQQARERRAARQEKGTIQGTVTDKNGEPVPGANVFLEGTTIGGATKEDGTYSFQAAAGDYTLHVRVVGYKSQTAPVTVTEGGTVTRDFQLKDDVLGFSEVVVTGTKNEKTKLESSVAITTLPQERLSETTAQSSADVLKVVPGFYVESSGGAGGNNLFVRGIPADGSFRYVQVQEDGMPVYESPELAFANIDELYRVDETMDRMEAVRGGSASIFASNAPGGIINIISKTGGPELKGLAKFSTAYHGLFRTDLDVGGPMGDKWRFNIGGFYRYDEGLRDPGFAGNKGGQIKANITRLLENGYIRIYGKYLNDRNVFYLPVPLQNPSNPTSIPGFDANYGTMTTSDAAYVQVPDPFGPQTGMVNRNLTNGMHPIVSSLGGELMLDMGSGWTLKNSLRATQVQLTFNAIFSLNNPYDATSYAQDLVDQTPGATDYQYSYAFRNGTFNPANANGNGLVAETGWWYVNKPMTNFANNFQLTKKVNGHSITAGAYFSSYTAGDLWAWNDILTEVKGNPGMLNLDLLDPNGNVVVSATDNGFRRYGSNYVHANNTGTVTALFIDDEWQVNKQFSIEGGLRYEVGDFRGQVEGSQSVDLGDPNTLADDNFLRGNGSFRPYDHLFHEWAGSIGTNYTFNDTFALFGRASKGFRMQDFETWMFGTARATTEDVYQYEGGVKISSPRFALFTSAFYSRLDNLPFNDTVIDPNTGELTTVNRFANSETVGLETEAIYETPLEGLRLNLIATVQDPKLRNFSFQEEDSNGNLVTTDYSGNRVKRIPQVMIDFKPSYQIGPVGVYGIWRYYGMRYSNNANTVELPAYSLFHAGISYKVNRVTLRGQITNIGNEIGLTEGNPRVDETASSQQQIYMARPVLPRSFNLSLTYNF